MKFKNKKVAVLGFGIEGKDLVRYLLKGGADISVLDQNDKSELDLSGFPKDKIKFNCGKQYLQNLDNFETIFRSPGVYRFIPELKEAENNGVEILSAITLFFDLCPAKIIGVTGTKGKGTTSTLIYQILKQSGKDVYLAGNIGKPILELLPELKKTSWIVLELSSFQLIDLEKSPHVAVVLNITSDHMDWHKNIKEYEDAKKHIVLHQDHKDCAVINYDFNSSRSFSKLTKAKVYYFSKSKKVNGCYVEKERIFLNSDRGIREIGNVGELLLRGKHNWENVTAAICATRLAGASIQSIKQAVFNFKGLEHRLELVGEVADVKFYNDSFATGPQSTIAAVNSFSEPATLILGGFNKGLEYDSLVKTIVQAGNIENIVVIGDIREKLRNTLIGGSYKGNIIDMGKTTLGKIVRKSCKVTPRGGVVIFSPATSSFDMFENYKDRGNQFKEAVKVLTVP